MKIAVLHSGDLDSPRPDEFETVQTCEDIELTLTALGHEPVRVRFHDRMGDTEGALSDIRPDVVFNMVEAAGGTDRLAYLGPALLDYLGLPYTGCPADALAMAGSKVKLKRLLLAAGVPTPDYFDGSGNCAGDTGGGPWFVKSATEHASAGIDIANIVPDAEAARALIARLDGQGGQWFAERFIDGGEFNVYLISSPAGDGAEVLGVSELVFTGQPEGKPNVYDYAAKWHFDTPDYDAIGRSYDVPVPLRVQLADLSVRVWDLLSLRGAVRLDFRVDAMGRPFVIDINLNPCMSTGCIFVEAASKVGLGFDDVIARLVAGARTGG